MCRMDTATALKLAMQAVKDAGIPEELWATALPMALADLRATTGSAPGGGGTSAPPQGNGRSGTSPGGKRSTQKKASPPNNSSAQINVLSSFGEQDAIFKKVAAETEVSEDDLGDVFHIDGGSLDLKVISKNLGGSKATSMRTVAALLGGLVFAGTQHTKLPFKEITTVCKAKHVHDQANGASYIKTTPGFASVAAGANQALTTKTGWQREFAAAVGRVLGKPADNS